MNIHPMFVHFPIALITVYACIELIRFKKIVTQPYWFYLKATFVILGAAGAVAARQTGEMAEDVLAKGMDGQGRSLMETHANWAFAVTALVACIAGMYALCWLSRTGIFHETGITGWRAGALRLITLAEYVQSNGAIMVCLAMAALAAITVTGSLGGAMVYGQSFDPLTELFYDTLVK